MTEDRNVPLHRKKPVLRYHNFITKRIFWVYKDNIEMTDMKTINILSVDELEEMDLPSLKQLTKDTWAYTRKIDTVIKLKEAQQEEQEARMKE